LEDDDEAPEGLAGAGVEELVVLAAAPLRDDHRRELLGVTPGADVRVQQPAGGVVRQRLEVNHRDGRGQRGVPGAERKPLVVEVDHPHLPAAAPDVRCEGIRDQARGEEVPNG
jgi:hypothetical protein